MVYQNSLIKIMAPQLFAGLMGCLVNVDLTYERGATKIDPSRNPIVFFFSYGFYFHGDHGRFLFQVKQAA